MRAGAATMWTEPPPVWTNAGVGYVPELAAARQQPVILRFASDDFMDDFMNTLRVRPERLRELRVQPETWRGFTPPPERPKPDPHAAIRRHLRLSERAPKNDDLLAEEPLEAKPAAPNVPLKLYQPAHQRHYLVTSSLVCPTVGLPDRKVDNASSERVGFVLRRLLPASEGDTDVATWEEHAWVPDPAGATWQRVEDGAATSLQSGEELLPMFGVNYDEGERRRRVFAGVVPTGRREAYLGAPSRAQPASGGTVSGTTSLTARKILLRKEVAEPWKALIARAHTVNKDLSATGDEAPSGAERIARLEIERAQVQAISWLVLLDLARFLSTYCPTLWRAIAEPEQAEGLPPAMRAAYDALSQTAPSWRLLVAFHWQLLQGVDDYDVESMAPDLRAALANFASSDGGVDEELAQQLERNDHPFDFETARIAGDGAWPPFLFPLTDSHYPVDGEDAPLPPAAAAAAADDGIPVPPIADPSLARTMARIDGLAALLLRTVEDGPEPAPEPAVPTAAVAPADALRGWFRIRCVYDQPECAPLRMATVSEPTAPFEIAGYFDADAPARPIRIGLPIDVTPAGLRKFDRNTAFVISDTLCGQLKRVKGLTFGDLVRSVLPWPLHKDLPDADAGPCRQGTLELGMICSLSIPIVTICALIVLVIMVTLLDTIFRWLPYLIMCFPLPGLKSKSEPSNS